MDQEEYNQKILTEGAKDVNDQVQLKLLADQIDILLLAGLDQQAVDLAHFCVSEPCWKR